MDVGTVYRALETTPLEDESAMLRIVDNEGDDYLYPARWFEAISEQELASQLSETLTVNLNGVSKVAVRDIANARGVSMSALVREWIDERLDLPEAM